MPNLTIDPPSKISTTTSPLLPFVPVDGASTNNIKNQDAANKVPQSPVAPEYSPITPRAQPALPATYPPPSESAPLGDSSNGSHSYGMSNQSTSTPGSAIAPAEYIVPPPPLPFSSEDSTDAIALRAAISSLQFQKKKARDDIRNLESIRKQALDDPALFKTELAAGRLKEQRPTVGNLQAILDQASDDEDEDEDEDEQALLSTSREQEKGNGASLDAAKSAEVPDSQSSRPTTSNPPDQEPPNTERKPPFSAIPGPQNVVRMPYINWDKYHVSGEALDSMHEQQRRWPGSTAYGTDRGREHAIAAPYSPWLDSPKYSGVGGQQVGGAAASAHGRTDSVATVGTVSEHPMETRRSRTNQ